MAMVRLRTFIGVDIGKAIRDQAVALQEKLSQSASGVKWVEPENLHVTLLNAVGVPVEKVGVSTGKLTLEPLAGV